MSHDRQSKAEKIARIAGRTSYKSFREGFGGRLCEDAAMDIKMALGAAQRRSSPLAVKALETKYASTMIHEDVLCREFVAHMVKDVWIGRASCRERVYGLV